MRLAVEIAARAVNETDGVKSERRPDRDGGNLQRTVQTEPIARGGLNEIDEHYIDSQATAIGELRGARLFHRRLLSRDFNRGDKSIVLKAQAGDHLIQLVEKRCEG